MTEHLSGLLNQYQDVFHNHIPRYRQNRFIQIVVLRETKSHAIFTTEGRTLDVERLQAGLVNPMLLDRVVMYKRKQIAPERRTGKALLRDLGILVSLPGPKGKDAKSKGINRQECEIMGHSCGNCPDCILYGYAATQGAGSQRARVLTDSGFVVRSETQVMRDIKLNAIQDTTAGGIAGSAFNSRENLIPQVFIPTVEALIDVTAAEFCYVLGNILKTTRYGAESNREGFIRNHILAVYFSDVELFSNLELTQLFYDTISQSSESAKLPDVLSLSTFLNSWPEVEKNALAQVVGRRRKVENLSGLLTGLQELYQNEHLLRPMLQDLDREVQRYIKEVKSKDKSNENGEEEAEV